MSDMKKTEFRQTTGVVSILSAQKDTRQKDDCEKNISIGGADGCVSTAQHDVESISKWDEAFASTTDEEFERLAKMFREDEIEGLMPLDFTEK